MSSDEKDKRCLGPTYRGPSCHTKEAEEITVEVRFDDKGNAVWVLSTGVPGRIEEGDTLDLLNALNSDSLSLKSDGDEADAGRNAIRD